MPLLGPLGLPTGFLFVGVGLGLTFSSVFSLSMSIVGMANISVLIGMYQSEYSVNYRIVMLWL